MRIIFLIGLLIIWLSFNKYESFTPLSTAIYKSLPYDFKITDVYPWYINPYRESIWINKTKYNFIEPEFING